MSKNIDKLYEISSNIYFNKQDFYHVILSLSKEEIDELNFKELDNIIYENDSIDFDTKVFYDKYFNRNLIFKKVIENPMYEPYEYLMYLAKQKPELRKEFLDILCVRTYSESKYNYFKESLEESNLYNEYVNSIINSNDVYLKCHFGLYFNYLDQLFRSHLDVACIIVNDDSFNAFANSRTKHLLKLSKISNDKEALNYINNVILFVTLKEENDYNRELDKYVDSFNQNEEITNIFGTKEEREKRKEKNLNNKLAHVIHEFKSNIKEK